MAVVMNETHVIINCSFAKLHKNFGQTFSSIDLFLFFLFFNNLMYFYIYLRVSVGVGWGVGAG